MSTTFQSFYFWGPGPIPDDSKWILKFTSNDADISKNARIMVENPAGKISERNLAVSGNQITQSLQTDHVYQIRVLVKFRNPAPADLTISALVQKADHTFWGGAFSETKNGKNGNIWRLTFVITGTGDTP